MGCDDCNKKHEGCGGCNGCGETTVVYVNNPTPPPIFGEPVLPNTTPPCQCDYEFILSKHVGPSGEVVISQDGQDWLNFKNFNNASTVIDLSHTFTKKGKYKVTLSSHSMSVEDSVGMCYIGIGINDALPPQPAANVSSTDMMFVYQYSKYLYYEFIIDINIYDKIDFYIKNIHAVLKLDGDMNIKIEKIGS